MRGGKFEFLFSLSHCYQKWRFGCFQLERQYSRDECWLKKKVQSYLTLCDPLDYSTPAFPVHHQLMKPTQTHFCRVGGAIQPSHPLSSCLLLSLIFPSIRVFSNESVLHIRWPKYWSFGISPSNEYPGLISFRIDWLDLLAIQGTLKSILQHHSSKA